MYCVPYANVVGSLMYVMACTRLDTILVMGVIRRYMFKYGKEY